MARGTFTATYPGAPRRRFGGLLLVLLGIGGLAALGYWWQQQKTPEFLTKTKSDVTHWAAWMQEDGYKPPQQVQPASTPQAADPTALALARMQAELAQMHAELRDLKNRPVHTPAPPSPPPAQAAAKVEPKRGALVVLDKQVTDKDPAADLPMYVLAPATKIACVVETAMNSDVESVFTVKTTTPVYDSETHRRLLIPPGSNILGQYKSAGLLYGNERLPTLTTTLALRNGKSVEIANMPVVNQEGMAGLVSDVNNHWWRNLGAVLIQGVLRGGAQAAQVAVNEGAGAQMVGGVASSTSNFGTSQFQRWINTRPTITVDPGELCNVIVTKELHLPAFAS
jgi:hypothetical protein